jgi:hypothetical protein
MIMLFIRDTSMKTKYEHHKEINKSTAKPRDPIENPRGHRGNKHNGGQRVAPSHVLVVATGREGKVIYAWALALVVSL